MPDLCRGSGASANALFDAIIALTGVSVEALFAEFLGPETASILAPVIEGGQIVATTVCSQPAPDDPLLDDNDIAGVLSPQDPLIFIPAAARVRQAFLHVFWPIICQCNDGKPPGSVSLQSPGTTLINPGLPSGSTGQACWDVTGVTDVAAHSPAGALWINGPWLPGQDVTGMGGFAGNSGVGRPVPTGVTQAARVSATYQCSGCATSGNVQLYFWDASKTLVGSPIEMASNSNPNATFFQFSIPTGTAYWGLHFPQDTSGNYEFSLEFQYFCAGTGPSTPSVPCCPPDPLLVFKLNQILGYVTLLQRQVAPFAYVPGSSHLGLTGNGTLAVQGLLGVKVTPTSLPPGVGVEAGDPDTLWLDSWITWGNADGWIEREWLRSAPYISLPNLAGQFTKLGYTIRPGMAVDIVELVREP